MYKTLVLLLFLFQFCLRYCSSFTPDDCLMYLSSSLFYFVSISVSNVFMYVQKKKRSVSLKNYFLRESKLWADCKTFIADLLVKGYMQKSVGASAKKKCWHIPHHCLYNVNKEKMRIFFDCSSKFNCWPLNCDLKSGPDN